MRVEEEDLRLVKPAAERTGRPEAELIRQALHLVAMSKRTWDEPFFDETLDLGGPMRKAEIRRAVDGTVVDAHDSRAGDEGAA